MASVKLQTIVVFFYFFGIDFSWPFNLGTPSMSLAIGAHRWEPLSLNRTKKQTAECSSEEWTCVDGGCISADLCCDGLKNCKDGSDESEKTCKSFFCPRYLFQCKYGACVDGDSKCNKVLDCADGSDEDCDLKMPLIVQGQAEQSGNSSYVRAYYLSPVMIPQVALPTTEKAKQSGYGGYISRAYSVPPVMIPQVASSTTEKAKQIQYGGGYGGHVIPPSNFYSSGMKLQVSIPATKKVQCLLPLYPVNGYYLTNSSGFPGDSQQFVKLNYSCNKGFNLVGRRENQCFDGSWDFQQSVCEKSKKYPGNAPSCGQIMSSVDFKIGESDRRYTEQMEFPWMVVLYVPKDDQQCILSDSDCWSFRCSGSLIGPKVVLVTGYCIYKYRQYQLKVRAGDWNINTFEELLPYQERFVNKIIFHPQHLLVSPIVNRRHDVALLVLESPYTLADNIGFICLPPPNLNVAPTGCKIAAWGTAIVMKTGFKPILKVVDLNYIDHNQCLTIARQRWASFVLHDSFTCASSLLNSGTCRGDGGSPLMCVAEDHYYLRGLDFGPKDCSYRNVPLFFTDVLKERNWIDQEMRANNFTTDTYTPVAYRK